VSSFFLLAAPSSPPFLISQQLGKKATPESLMPPPAPPFSSLASPHDGTGAASTDAGLAGKDAAATGLGEPRREGSRARPRLASVSPSARITHLDEPGHGG